MDRTHKKKAKFSGIYLFLGLLLAWLYATYVLESMEKTIPFSDMIDHIRSGRISQVLISETEIRGWITENDSRRKTLVVAKRVPSVDGPVLADLVRQGKASIVGDPPETQWWMHLLYWLPFVLILVVPYLFGMRALGRSGGPLRFGNGRIRIYDSSESTGERVRFSDVAGIDEARDEVAEIVAYLRDPQKFARLGARIPKGVLLVGPPGTGKTLLARAVAGEANVPFFAISGSEFIEMFVGVGAARVRELFAQANEKAPCIIFIDEIDAVGRSRGGQSAVGTHEEREQTLNQLLTEMDGFDSSKGVVILAATNRPEVLDSALMRSGRFDRQIVVDAPDVAGRAQILAVHTRKVPLGDDVDLEVVAKRTPGMVGADLAKVVNEAALAAARRNASAVAQRDFDEAVDRIQLGLKRKRSAMRETEKARIAFHEAGHALVSLRVDHADPVHKVTIIPRSMGALGATLQLPETDRYLLSKQELEDRICVLFGGRAAEELVWGEPSTGSQNDIARASDIARDMVCRFGMSPTLGPRTVLPTTPGLQFLPVHGDPAGTCAFSEKRAREIDDAIDAIIDHQYRRALDILRAHRDELQALADELMAHETIDRAAIERIVPPRPSNAQTSN